MFSKWFSVVVTATSDVRLGSRAFFRRLLLKLGCSHHPSSPPPTFADIPGQSLAPLPSPARSITIGCPTPRLFALVIGINKYLSNEVRDLSGAVADADDVSEFLQKTLGVPKDQIKNLRNEQATRVTIETEINNLGNNLEIAKDDAILIFYAGHGAEARAPSGWPNANGKLQMLLPYDFIFNGSSNSSEGQGVLDITLSRLLRNVAEKKSDNITVVLDCCHSGSGTRPYDSDPTFAVRGIDLPKTYAIAEDLLHDIEPDAHASFVAKGFEKAGLLSHVLLTACKQGQEATERDGHGAFTSALLSLLRQNDVDKLTYQDVILNLPGLPSQDPQCEGVHQSRFVFNSKVTSPQHRLYPIRAFSDSPGHRGQYILEAGEAHGITTNAEFVVFTDRSMTSTALGSVIAVETTDFTTTCRFSVAVDQTQPFILAHPGYALQTRVGNGQDFCLFIEADEKLLDIFKRIAAEMRSDQAGKRGFRLAENRDDADLVVAADGDLVHFEIMNQLCRKHGLARMPFEVKIDDLDAIRGILHSSADFYWYLHRSSERAPLSRKVKVECTKLTETGEYTDDLEEILEPDPNGDNLNNEDVIFIDVDEEAIYGFKIFNTESVPLYVSMFYFDVSDLSISTLFPNLQASRPILLTTLFAITGLYYQPGSAWKDVDVSLPPGESLSIGYGTSGTVPHMYTLRKGQDVDVGFLKLFFSTEYLDLSGVVQRSPFTESRGSRRVAPQSRYLWDEKCIAVIQKRGKDSSGD
ncbi:caspase domain-containing protein [Armillaria novae-zelandiae]|uniref:Caspase domain-containing protein n=1 Tax=Armillaria novae-zelandiae TaxID=153914 RepID=A0AA39NT88_9AGAR|nr:caspase domain-containing protein [Armillaria novae-zelandiae]